MSTSRVWKHAPSAYVSLLAAAGTLLLVGGRAGPAAIPLKILVPLLIPPFVLLLRGRLVLRSSLLLLSLLVLLLARLAEVRTVGKGEAAAAAEAYAEVDWAVGAQADSLSRWAAAVAADPGTAVVAMQDPGRRDREALFALLETWGRRIEECRQGEGVTIQILREGETGPIAWWGDVPDLGETGRRGTVRVASDPLRIHLVADALIPATDRRPPPGSVLVMRAIGGNPDLATAVGREAPFARSIRERVGGDVRFDLPGGEGEHVIRSGDGTEIARAGVLLPSAGEGTRAVRARAANAVGFLILLFWATFFSWGGRRGASQSIVHEGSVRALALRIPVAPVLALRTLLLLLDFPARLGGGGGTTGPEAFSSPILLGAWKSPADAALTGLVLLLVSLAARERTASAVRAGGPPSRFRLLPILLILGLLTAASVGFAALVREIHLSTTLGLFERPNPLGSAPMLLVELALFLSAAAYLLIIDALFVLASRFGRALPGAPDRLAFSSRVLLGALFACAVLLLTGAYARGGMYILLAPLIAVATGLLLFYLLRGRGWRVWSGFGFVIAAAVVTYPHLDAAREESLRLRLEERALHFANPKDEWKRFLLEETLRFFERDPVLLEKLARRPLPPMEREAFLAWDRSGLSRRDYSVDLRILDRQGAVVSRFALDMPAESAVRAAFAFRDIRASGEMKIYEGRRRLRGTSTEIYTGAVPLFSGGDLVGAVLVSIPYFYGDLEFAAKLPESSYEIFHNPRGPEGTPAGRTEDLQVFLYRGGEAALSSSDRFPAETSLDSALLRTIEANGPSWGRLHVGGRPHDAFFTPWTDPDREGILAFALPRKTALDHARSLADLVLGSLFFALLILVVVLPVPLVLSLRGGERGAFRFEATFRDRLVLAFLVVALLPALLLGAAGRRMVASRLREAGEDAARVSLQSVRYALERDVIREAEEIARSTLVRRRVLGVQEGEELLDLELGLKRFAIFSPDGRLILQNGKVGSPDARAFAEVVERRAPAAAFDLTDGLSLVSLVGISLEGFEERLEGVLLLSKPIDDEWVSDLGERVGLDVSFYEEGTVRSSTRFELYQAGMLSPRLPAAVYASLDLKGEEVRFERENIAGTTYLVGYGSLRGFDGLPVGTVSVPLLFREKEAERDLERAYAAITYLTFLVLVVIVLVAETMGERIARPVRDLSRGMERISAGDLEQTVPTRTGGEFGRLVRAFNRMAGDLKRSRGALTERTRYIETVLGSVGAGVIAFDREGRVASANRAAAEILEVAVRELHGARLDRAAEGRLEPLHRIVSGLGTGSRRVHEGEAEIRRERGMVTLRVVATAITDAEGRDLGRVIVFEDLTDLIRSKKLLAWGEMARQVAHEIKNPLTPMKLSVQHLKRAYRDGDRRFGELLDESADLIIEEIGTLQRIAAEFSTFARMPRREVQPVGAAPLIRETIRLYGEGFPESRLEVDVPQDLPVLHVDREEIRRLLINLLENAVQATAGRGAIRVSARVEDGSPGNQEGWKLWETTAEGVVHGPMLTVRILDDGPGVPEAARGKLFEPNFSTKTNGTGLGLAICRAIVADYGGVIAIGSTPGRGTVAVVSLPLQSAV